MSKKQMIRQRSLSVLLALVMCLGLLPGTAWAAVSDDAISITEADSDGTDPAQPAAYRLVYNSEDGELYKEYPDRSRAVYTA